MIADRGYTAPAAPVAALAAFLDTMGLERAVIAHVTAHGLDMSVTLDAIAALDGRARGIAMVAPEVSDDALDRLHAGGIRGVRLTPLFGAAVTFEALERMGRRIARLGWHLVYAPPDRAAWLEAAPRLSALPVEVVVDHLAWRGWRAGDGLDQPGFRALLDAVAADRCWVKIAAPERYSGQPAPWADVAGHVRALVEARPERLIWGSDWPHVRAWDHAMPNDADLVDWIEAWGASEATLRRILVDNPATLYGFDDTA
jgi:predicted TIM-barrel fold metal-dependent hydrolase